MQSDKESLGRSAGKSRSDNEIDDQIMGRDDEELPRAIDLEGEPLTELVVRRGRPKGARNREVEEVLEVVTVCRDCGEPITKQGTNPTRPPLLGDFHFQIHGRSIHCHKINWFRCACSKCGRVFLKKQMIEEV